MHFSKSFAAVTALLLCAPDVARVEDRVPGQIIEYPWAEDDAPFRPHNLAYEFPKDGVARAEFRSEMFYAIILLSGPRCSFTEAHRQEIQALFPGNQVFFEKFDCPDDPEDLIYYSNVNSEYAFLAVYGGQTRKEALRLFKSANIGANFPGANIRKMQAILAYP